MWQRFTPYDLRVIGHYLGTLALFFAVLMILPLAPRLSFRNGSRRRATSWQSASPWSRGCCLRFLRIEPGRLYRGARRWR